MFAGKKSAQIREILISESAWEEMTCLFAPSLDMKAFNAGSAVPSLNRNHIHSLSYPLPPMALVNLFESSALLLHQRAHVNLKHSQSLALLRDTLLPKLLSGEITLPEAEQAVSEAENV